MSPGSERSNRILGGRRPGRWARLAPVFLVGFLAGRLLRWPRRPRIGGPRYLIVNADDFGLTGGITEGILRAWQAGTVTSTSALINVPGAPERIAVAHAAHPGLPIGLHLNITTGRPVLPAQAVPSLVDSVGRFHPMEELLLRLPAVSLAELQAELQAQAALMQANGVAFDHLDYHQMAVAFYTPFFPVVRALARQFDVPVRLPVPESIYGLIRLPGNRRAREAIRYLARFSLGHLRPALQILPHMLPSAYRREAAHLHAEGIGTPNWFIDRYYQNPTMETFVSILAQLPSGVSELMVHPGLVDPALRALDDDYVEERMAELEVLLDPRLPQAIHRYGVRLVDFSFVPSRSGA